jgi:GTP-binding protein Era
VAALASTAELELDDAEVFPISARDGSGTGELLDHLAALMPEGPFLFESGASSDQPRELLVAELIREAAIRRTFQEVPHALEVIVEEIEWPSPSLARVRALIWVETESQKRILIGAHGSMVKAIGTAARRELERVLQARVHLDLSVRVRRDWRGDEGLLDRLGIT